MNIPKISIVDGYIAISLWFTSQIAVCDSGQPFLETLNSNDPLRITGDSLDTATMIVWGVKGFAIIASTYLVIRTGKLLHLQAHTEAFWSFVGAIITGVSAMIVETLLLG